MSHSQVSPLSTPTCPQLTNRSILGRIRNPQNSIFTIPTRSLTTHHLLHIRCIIRNVFRTTHSTFRRPQNPSTGIHPFSQLFTCSTQLTCFDNPSCYACHQDGRFRSAHGGLDGTVWESRAGLWAHDCELRGSRAVVVWRLASVGKHHFR